MICNQCNNQVHVSSIDGALLCYECFDGGVMTSEILHDAHIAKMNQERYECQGLHSDLYKDWCGSRPRIPYDAFPTPQAWDEEINMIGKWVEEQIKEDKILQEQDVTRFEEKIKQLIDMGAKTRENALRWLSEAEEIDDQYGNESIEYHFGLPYGYLKQAA